MPTRHLGAPEEVLALDTFIKLMRAVNTLRSAVSRSLAQVGLTESQLGVLECLHHLGPMCQKQIGEKLLISGGNVTMVVDNLEKRDLVQRRRESGDRRFVRVYLTEAGQSLIEDYFPLHARAVTREFSALDPQEQRDLGRLCRKLGLARATAGDACCRAPDLRAR